MQIDQDRGNRQICGFVHQAGAAVQAQARNVGPVESLHAMVAAG